MTNAFIQLALFAGKTLILLIFFVLLLVIFIAVLSKGKGSKNGKLTIKNLNHKYDDIAEALNAEIVSKKKYKQLLKARKAKDKEAEHKKDGKNIYVLNFHGDIKASAVTSLTEEINAVLNVVTPADEVVVRVESGGGVVHGYGLAAAQLLRFRKRKIPLTVAVDKVAASGGYMMAAVASKIIAAPFAIIGSIGVLVQLPNFHRVLKDKHIDFEQFSAGKYKRTLTIFGENTEEGREKLQTEIEEVHGLFKNLISQHRKNVDIDQVATGEYWLGQQALALNLVDEINTSDDYLFDLSKRANIYEICYEVKKPLLSKLMGAHTNKDTLFERYIT